MAFQFRLEQVLSYRKQLEEQAMQEFARAAAERDAVKARMDATTAALAEIRKSLTAVAGMGAGERWLARSSESGYLGELEVLRIRLDEKELEVDRCRQVLIQKAQERELLDKLKEKQARRHAHEQRLAEQRTNDETATLRFKPASY